MRKRFLVQVAAIALIGVAGAGMAQDRPESLLPPGFDETPAPTPAPAPAPAPSPRPAPAPSADEFEDEDAEDADAEDEEFDLEDEEEADDSSSSSERFSLSTGIGGFGEEPWGALKGRFAKIALRRMDAPLASRWAHIGLRNALMADGPAPESLDDADWAAERAWLLLRMGEADAARLLIGGVPRSAYDAKMAQVATQVALATSDMAAICPVPGALDRAEPRAEPLVRAICAALAGQPEVAADAISRARRRGPVGGIDLSLAEKLVGAGSSTARAVTIEWDPVDRMTAWRFGLASATGMEIPDRLLRASSPQMIAWHARAPLLSAQHRLASARVATGLGVFSGQALTDVYSLVYDASDADALAGSDALALRRAFVAAEPEGRIESMRALWNLGATSDLELLASWAATARAASRITPSTDFEDDATSLIASMFAAGLDREAARWLPVIAEMDEDDADASWAMLAVGVENPARVDTTRDRVSDFVGRDESKDQIKSKLLVAALAGLGRIDPEATGAFNARLELGLQRHTKATKAIDGASARREAATAMLMTAMTMQTKDPENLSPLYLFHALTALRRTGQDYLARMIAAELMSRT
ncbi:hypothetical protein [Sphingomicrobium nitratireducens]|uniref:hypothetical protein n=1 Tax=Sphingomicrobium nitratireducens TaxID=2964666 RepID=UPI0022403F4B|nr:hypothetical protein [Sphingomicrobium nitratireducens]